MSDAANVTGVSAAEDRKSLPQQDDEASETCGRDKLDQAGRFEKGGLWSGLQGIPTASERYGK